MTNRNVAFITGISGQDGSYLAEHLVSLDYEVHGIIRRNSNTESQYSKLDHLSNKINLVYGDLTDQSSLDRVIREYQPTEIYNLGAQSHVRISSDIPQFTTQVNAVGVLNILEAYKNNCPTAKFYQASSSEMFGSAVDEDGYQRLTTPFRPVSPYGCTKVFAYNIVHHYRNAYNLHANNGILFNHESPRRGINFVTNKVVKTAVEISLGLATTLELGNLDSYRDWGHSKDYVRAMHLILQQPNPDDYIVATGESRSVRDMCDYVFGQLGLNYKEHVVQVEKFMRPEELQYLRGDASKIRNELGWKPEYDFSMLMDEMIAHWQTYYKTTA
jgi:GDPmannose 4,6-dehydratase